MASTAAPGQLEIVREFVNTVEIEDASDPMTSSDELAKWCRDTGLCAGTDEQGLARLRAFREALRDVLETHAGEGEEAERWRALEPFAVESRYKLSVTEQGRPALRPQGTGVDAVIAQIFAIVYDAIGDGTWPRLKACRKHSCRWAFYDRSKNGSGAWCSMKVCGNRVKAQRRRERQKPD